LVTTLPHPVKLTRTVQFNPLLFQLVPALNVLFLVFMLFAMSSRFVLQPGIAVTLPLSSFTLGPQRQPQIVSVTAAPVPAIYFRDQKITLRELAEHLATQTGQQHALIIKADKGAPYDMVVQIMNQALKRGYSVALATTPEVQP
jgi:biopolymer transport protein ExbD